MKINYTHQVNLWDHNGHIAHLFPTASHREAVLLADLWIIFMKRRHKYVDKLATIEDHVQVCEPEIHGLGRVRLLERGEEKEVMWLYHRQDASTVGRLWRASGKQHHVKRTYKLFDMLARKPMDKAIARRWKEGSQDAFKRR